MTLSTAVVKHPRFESFEDYFNYTDNNDWLYELFNGELIEVPPESVLQANAIPRSRNSCLLDCRATGARNYGLNFDRNRMSRASLSG